MKIPATDATTFSAGSLAMSSASSAAALIAATTGFICTTCPERIPVDGARPTPRITISSLSESSAMRASTRWFPTSRAAMTRGPCAISSSSSGGAAAGSTATSPETRASSLTGAGRVAVHAARTRRADARPEGLDGSASTGNAVPAK